MNRNWPPTRNEPAPNVDRGVFHALRSVARVEDRPVFRLVWGQDRDHCFTYGSKEFMKYRHHVEKRKVWGEAEYALDGSFVGWKRFYERADIVPTDAILVELLREDDVGIPRWFVEYAVPVDRESWERDRWTDETGTPRFSPEGDRLDFLGEFPEGGIDYESCWMIADHHGCCAAQQNGIGRKDDGTLCYGSYRNPSLDDVSQAQARWNYLLKHRPYTYGLREAPPDALVKQGALDKARANQAHWDKVEADCIDDIQQALTPFKKRLTSEGHGPDLFRYVDLGSRTTTAGDNTPRPPVVDKEKT